MRDAKRVLVTGGRGFIGQPCLAALARLGYDVHAVSRQRVASSPDVTWHAADLLDRAGIAALLGRVRPTDLLHLAWCTEHGAYWTSPDNLHWLAASVELVHAFAAHGGRRLVVAGSCAEYGDKGGLCVAEQTPTDPETLYGTCKHALNLVVRSFAPARGISAAWARLFHLFGPREHPARLVPSIVRPLLAGEPARCSDGRQIRDYLYVDDAASALTALLDSSVIGVVNVASGVPVTLAALAERAASHTSHPELLRIGESPARRADAPILVADVRRLAEEVGWTARIDVDEALDRTVAWWAAQTPSRTASIR